MFHLDKIKILEGQVTWLESERAVLLNRIRDTEHNLELLMKHLGVKLESVSKRQVVPLTETDKMLDGVRRT